MLRAGGVSGRLPLHALGVAHFGPLQHRPLCLYIHKADKFILKINTKNKSLLQNSNNTLQQNMSYIAQGA